jgi:phosphate transport system protein
MRTDFHDNLDDLRTDLGDMCTRAAAMMESATAALLSAEVRAVDRIQFDLKRLTRLGNAVHDRAFGLLALQAPVAGDLRTVVCALHIAADADRMGGLAAHVARTAGRRSPAAVVPDELTDLFERMGVAAVGLACDAGAAVRTADPSLARDVCAADARLDEAHRELFTRVVNERWAHGPQRASDLVLVGRFYERFGDHAVEIGRRVYFQATGAHLSRAEV